jgi:hypothetical protein
MRILIAAIGALAVSACSHDVRLAFPNAAGSANEFTCSVDTAPANCKAGGTHNPADDNRSGVVTVTLPVLCARFHQITIYDAGSSRPTAHVLCAPPENPIAKPDQVGN